MGEDYYQVFKVVCVVEGVILAIPINNIQLCWRLGWLLSCRKNYLTAFEKIKRKLVVENPLMNLYNINL